MRKLGLISTIAALTLALATPALAQRRDRDRSWDDDDGPKETERVERTVPIRAGGLLTLKNFSGRVTITGSNRADVSVRAIRTASRERLDNIKLDISETGSGLRIDANKKSDTWRDRNNNVVHTELEILVPADIGVDVDVFSSDVAVRDVRGKQKVHTFSGEIELSGGESTINAETFSGDITVRLPGGASASVDFDSFSGSLRTDVPMSYRSGDRRHIRGEIGSGGNDYRFKTFSGDVRIR